MGNPATSIWLGRTVAEGRKGEGLHAGWWMLFLLLLLIGSIWLTYALFTGTLKQSVPVTLMSDRSGLVMDTNAKVRLRGVPVGRVAWITGGTNGPAAVSFK